MVSVMNLHHRISVPVRMEAFVLNVSHHQVSQSRSTRSIIFACDSGVHRSHTQHRMPLSKRWRLFVDWITEVHMSEWIHRTVLWDWWVIDQKTVSSINGAIYLEYFHCLSNGRFTDRYNCLQGKYFECVHGEGEWRDAFRDASSRTLTV